MLSRWSVVSVSLAAVLCSAALADPKPAPLRQGPARSVPRQQHPMFSFPNMTQIPKCHLVAGLRTDRSGTVFTDTSGKIIAQTDRMTGHLVWLDEKPTQSAHSR